MHVWRNIDMLSCNNCFSGKAVSITYSECVFVALHIQHTMLMHHIVICGLSGCTNVSTLSHKRHDFRKKSLLSIKCVWFALQILSETFLILKIIEWDKIKNVYWSSYELPVTRVRAWWNLITFDRFSRNT
jgi:hypothetical protein